MDKKVEVGEKSSVYSGNIKLTLKKGTTPYKIIKKHNTGTFEFFKYILKAVRGDVLPNDRPAHVKLIYYINETTERISKYGVMYNDKPKVSDSYIGTIPKATMTYNFLIPETVVELGKIKGLQLESANGVIYAKVYFKNDELVEINKNTNIELDWELNICNYEEN